MNRSWVRFPQAAQIRPPGFGWAFLYVCVVSRCCLWLVAPRVFRAPEGPAAREARRPHFVRRRASKPARALRSLRRPPHQWRLVADVWLGASSQGPPWPCHRPSISHVIPLRLVQALNIYRWNCNVFGVSRKMTAGNYVRLLVSVGSAAAFGCWGRTLRPFMRLSSLRRWGFCTTRSLLAACRRRVEPSCSAIPPDWCRRQPRVSRLGPADQAARLSETPVAFAGAGRASTETVIAFAGEKWAFLERFSVAVVLLVSTVAFQGRAVVMGVSCWPASVAAEVSLVSKSPRAGSCARKSSPCLV